MIDLGIEKVFRTFREHGVQCLLSGGQACIFYGAAEFSKDVDFVVLADSGNFERLEKAADALAAETIAVPPFDIRHFDVQRSSGRSDEPFARRRGFSTAVGTADRD
jgi:hypothetical protein